jgi:general transcription factor 3C polypeptide 3 (transcription factor C subunit 4)
MVKNEEELATEILEHVLWAGLFFNRRSEVAIRLTIIGELLS